MNGSTVSQFVSNNIFWLFVAILAVNLFQRKYLAVGERKRFATLYMSMVVLAVMAFSALLLQFSLPDWLFLPFIALLAGTVWVFRAKIFPFRRRCARCSVKLPFDRILYYDNNLCAECDAKEREAREGLAPEHGTDEQAAEPEADADLTPDRETDDEETPDRDE